jgi:lysozyme
MPPDADKQLEAGSKAVPALRYAYGLIGIAGAATTILGGFKSPQLAVAAIIMTLIGMVLVRLFSRLTDDTKKADPAARVMVWASVSVFVLCVALLATLGVWRKPTYLADILGLPALVHPPSDFENQIIIAIFSTLQIDPSTVDPKIHDDDRAAVNFIETYARQFCAATSDSQLRVEVHCGTGSVSLAVQAPPLPAELPAPSTIVLNRAPLPIGDACAGTALAKLGTPPPKIFGLDVTHLSGSIDWAKVVASGYYFVFVKATQGLSFVDPSFKQNWDAAGQFGLIRGAYHFLGTAGGDQEASFFLSTLKGITLGPCDVGAALDLEQDMTSTNASTARIDQALSWLIAVKAALGKAPILYAGISYLAQLGDPASFAAYPLWIASYSPTPRLPPSRSSYAFWQFTDGHFGPQMGPLTGVDTEIFNGTPAELFALAR